MAIMAFCAFWKFRPSSIYTGISDINVSNKKSVTLTAKWSGETLAKHIINLTCNASESSTSIIGNTNLAYDSSSDHNLRYVGAAKNNYISFNNETWRIIGVFKGIKSSASGSGETRVKIIRNSSLGSKQWHSTRLGRWDTSDLNTYLNGTYYSSLSSAAKSLITNAYWSLGGLPSTLQSITASQAYAYEKGTTVYNGWSYYHVNRIALANHSDFGYASTACKDDQDYLGKSTCKNSSTNWLYFGVQMWLLDTHQKAVGVASEIYVSSGHYSDHWDYADMYNEVYPSVFLSAETLYSGGNGSSSEPYKIAL